MHAYRRCSPTSAVRVRPRRACIHVPINGLRGEVCAAMATVTAVDLAGGENVVRCELR